jgi:hypothetical protein
VRNIYEESRLGENRAAKELTMNRGSFACVMLLLCAAATVANVTAYNSQRSSRRKNVPRPAALCFDPNVKCRTSVTFEPNDLPFQVPANGVIYETEFFYAVILKSMKVADDNCETFVTEAERLQVQALFPARKVFTSRCAEPGFLYYTNVDPGTRFMAVYAGATKAQAAQALARVKATGKFPGANLRRMRAGFNGT